MEPLPRFPLFRDPVAAKCFEQSDAVCTCCGRARGWVYVVPIYRKDNEERTICPWCLHSGSAASKFDCRFNVVDIQEREDGEESDLEMTRADRAVVERRTPSFVTWQGVNWQACCGRVCEYVGEAVAADLAGRWKAAVPSILKDLRGWSEKQKAELIANIGTDPAVYVFECQVCGGLKGFWDRS